MVKKLFFLLFVFLVALDAAYGQELPDDEVQINFNGYFDNADVNIVYPSISMTMKVGESTSVRGLYQIDAVSAASMKSSFEDVKRSPFSPDGISSASKKNTKPDAVSSASKLSPSLTDPDDVRHEFMAGVTQVYGYTSVSLSGIYSTEHDYDSKTIALSVSQPFNQKNTVAQLGLVRSWDNVFPDIQQMKDASWEKSKDVYTLSAGLSQVLERVDKLCD